jgi:hypothetical protein
VPTFSVKFDAFDLRPPGFTPDQMRAFGVGCINEMEGRLARGQNIYDQAAEPLTARYLKAKIKVGASPLRDLRLTGQTLESLAVIDADEKHVKVGFNNADAYKKALFSQNIEPMFGLSPNNEQAVVERVHDVLVENLKSAPR